MRKHNNNSSTRLPTGRQTRQSFPHYWRHCRNIHVLQMQLADLMTDRQEWQELGYDANVAYLDARISCLTGIICGGYPQREAALAKIMEREVKVA